MNSKPYISIIVSTLNCSGSIENCLASLMRQSFRSLEIIVVDGGSTDGTVELLEAHSEELDWWCSEQDHGIYDAWNKGIKASTGEWLCFLGADDVLAGDTVLEVMISELEKAETSEHRLVYSPIALVNQKGEILEVRGKSNFYVEWQLNHGMPKDIPHTGMLHRRSIFEEHGMFDADFAIAGDYDLILRELKSNKNSLLFVDKAILVSKGTGGISDTNRPQCIKEFHKARKKNNMRAATIPWCAVYIRAMIRQNLLKITNWGQ
ncbi:MAG: glycosyltransferase family 2 protein [Halioglobus sp.]